MLALFLSYSLWLSVCSLSSAAETVFGNSFFLFLFSFEMILIADVSSGGAQKKKAAQSPS